MEDKINKTGLSEKSPNSTAAQVAEATTKTDDTINPTETTEVTVKTTDTANTADTTDTTNPADIDKKDGVITGSTAKNSKVKSSKKKFIILAVVALLLVVIAVVVVVILLNRDNKESERNNTTKTDTAAKEDVNSDANASAGTTDNAELANLSSEERVKAIVARVKSKITSDKLSIKDADDFAPDYRAEGMKAYTKLDRGIGFSVSTANNRDEEATNYLMSDELANLIVGELQNAGFEDYGSTLWSSGSYLNPESGVVCTVSTKTIPSSLWCGHTSWISEDTKALVNELAEAVAASDEEFEDPDTLVFNVVGKVPQDSSYKPYQTLTVGLSWHGGFGGAAGLFYRTSPDAKWQFFTGTQGALLCSEYDTADLQKAYMGVGCWDEINKQDSVVTLQ